MLWPSCRDLKPTHHPWGFYFFYEKPWTGILLNIIVLMRLIILFAYCRQNGENRPILYLFEMLLFLNNIKTPFIFSFGLLPKSSVIRFWMTSKVIHFLDNFLIHPSSVIHLPSSIIRLLSSVLSSVIRLPTSVSRLLSSVFWMTCKVILFWVNFLNFWILHYVAYSKPPI